MTWRPLLDGADAARARELVAAIADSLAVPPGTDPSLARGSAGIALLHGYRALDGDEASADRTYDALAHALEHVANLRTAGLFDGVGGILFAAQHLEPIVGEVDALADLDLVIGEASSPEYELCTGLVGLGVVLRERGLPVDHIVEALAARAERSASGLAWRSPPPYEGINVGLAHGVAGVASFLASTGASTLLSGAVVWLLSHIDTDAVPSLPLILDGAAPLQHRYDGWCYGEAAIAIALYRAGQATTEARWIEAARSLARRAASRTREDFPGFTIDHTICHGAISRAHLFNRLGQAMDDDQLLDAARRWYRDALQAEAASPTEPGFQVGVAGLALGLLAGCSSIDPTWDRLMLLSDRAA